MGVYYEESSRRIVKGVGNGILHSAYRLSPRELGLRYNQAVNRGPAPGAGAPGFPPHRRSRAT